MEKPPLLKDIHQAHRRIIPFIRQTPVVNHPAIDEIAGCEIHFKCENLQPMGAFKIRGAIFSALSLPPVLQKRGLATHSSGNHGAAVAYAAREIGVEAHIVMPDNAPLYKRNNVASYGAKIYESGPATADREARMEEVLASTEATFIHPYKDYSVITGAATASKEFLEEIPFLQAIVVPVGGGGIASGTALYCSYSTLPVIPYGAEPQAVDDAYRSFRSGTLQTNNSIDTIADGLRTNIGDINLAILSRHLRDIYLTGEENILQATQILRRYLELPVEYSAAVPLAAILENKLFSDMKIGIILTGGNSDED